LKVPHIGVGRLDGTAGQASTFAGMSSFDHMDFAATHLTKAKVEKFPLRRVRHGRETRIVNEKSEPADVSHINRIKALVIPPAWRNVRISADPRSHIQAVGRDDAGRRQYIYHREWERVRSADKACRLLRLVQALPRIRRAIARDLDSSGNERILATAMRLVDRLGLRAGHEEYAGEESGRGAASLLKKHVRVSGGKLQLDFPGKSKKHIRAELNDPKCARNIRRALKIPGVRLFRIITAQGMRNMTAVDLNEYLFGIAGQEVSAKDFRTLQASSLAVWRLNGSQSSSKREREREALAVAKKISAILCNTPAIVRKSYIHPQIIECHMKGRLAIAPDTKAMRGRSKPETLLLKFLRLEVTSMM
jgi:DNA topoisomerase-1